MKAIQLLRFWCSIFFSFSFLKLVLLDILKDDQKAKGKAKILLREWFTIFIKLNLKTNFKGNISIVLYIGTPSVTLELRY